MEKLTRWFLSKSTLLGVLIVVTLISFWETPYFRLPWYDEVMFSSISADFAANGTAHVPVGDYGFDTRNHYEYGPVFLGLNGWLLHSTGFSYLVPRLLGVIPGILLAGLLAFVIRRYYYPDGAGICLYLFPILLLADHMFQIFLQYGRMDILSLLLFYTGFVLWLDFSRKEKPLPLLVATFLLALAYLTTSRLFIYLLPLALLLLVDLIRNFSVRRLLFYALSAVTFFLPFLGWIYWAYGGIAEFREAASKLSGDYLFNRDFVFTVGKYQYPLYLLAIITAGLAFYFRKKLNSTVANVLLFSVLAIVSYYIFVNEAWSSYNVFVIVPMYFILAYLPGLMSHIDLRPVRLGLNGLLLMIFLVSAGMMSVKTLLLFINKDNYSHRLAREQLAALNKEGKRWVGDERFYYMVEGEGGTFQYLCYHKPEDWQRTLEFHRDTYKMDYFIVAVKQSSMPDELQRLYIDSLSLKEIKRLPLYPESRLANKLKRFLPESDINYEAVIYSKKDPE